MNLRDLLNENRTVMSKVFSGMLSDFFGFMKTLDKELPKQAENNPDLAKDVAHLMQLKESMIDAMDEWAKFLIGMDENHRRTK